MNDERVWEFKRNTGISQGCNVSPLLFVLCTNGMSDRMNAVWPEERLNVLMYADDTVMWEVEERTN